jgi:hypothetical protein
MIEVDESNSAGRSVMEATVFGRWKSVVCGLGSLIVMIVEPETGKDPIPCVVSGS